MPCVCSQVTRHHDYVTKLPRVLSAVGVRVDADSWTMADADADDSPPSPVPAADGVIDMDDEVPPPPDKTAPSEQRVEGEFFFSRSRLTSRGLLILGSVIVACCVARAYFSDGYV